jgi:hypothetical protein
VGSRETVDAHDEGTVSGATVVSKMDRVAVDVDVRGPWVQRHGGRLPRDDGAGFLLTGDAPVYPI